MVIFIVTIQVFQFRQENRNNRIYRRSAFSRQAHCWCGRIV